MLKLKPIAANMTELETPKMKVLFSYQTPVAAYNTKSKSLFRTSKIWSNTTTRHINKWIKQFPGTTYAAMPQEWFDILIEEK